MSIRPMTKRCEHCHRTFTYNPSVGNFGMICPHCGFPASSRVKPTSVRIKEKKK